MKVFVQVAAVCLFASVAFAAPGPIAEPVCDVVCPETFPIEENWHLPYTGDCSKFCHCANDGNWKKDCPEGLHFNAKLQVCDWPNVAGCESTAEPTTAAPTTAAPTTAAPTTAEPTTQEPTTEKPTTQKPTTTEAAPSNICETVCPAEFPITHNNHLPYPGDCSMFCHCANDGKHPKECPAGLHFNPTLQVCDWPHSAGCDSSVTTIAPPHVPAGCEDQTCGDDECEKYPNTGNCQQYCDCHHGTITLKECSEGLHFNPATGNCDYPENAECEVKPPATGCEHVECNAHDCFKTHNTLDCNLYCDCDHGDLTIGHCAADLHFNKASETCDFPWSANCEITPTEPSGGEEPITTPAAPSLLCDQICPDVWPVVENNHLFPGDCTKFCHCANDGNWLKDCPAGLHFNAKLQVCDWPNHAGCENKLTFDF